MCNPAAIAVAGFAINAGQQIGRHRAASQEAARGRAESRRAFELTVSDIQGRRAEERQATQFRIGEVERAALRSASVARLAAAEAGVAGRTVDLLVGEVERQRGEARSAIEANLEITERQLRRQERQADAGLQSRLNQFRSPSITPLLIGLGTGAVGTLANELISNDPEFRTNAGGAIDV